MRFGIRRQRGTTLVVALIMLVLLTLFAVSSLNTANTNLKVVGNMQQKSEALHAAQQTIESVLSTPQFIVTNPEDLGCASGQQQQFGVYGAVTGDSLCANTIWEVRARTLSTTSNATVTVTQGVGVRVSTDDAGTSC
jgi:Tfp pilus assembly protein PilX